MALKHSNPSLGHPRTDSQTKQSVYARAPYNFVPLPERMVAAQEPLDHDRYITNPAYSGWIDCELETCSPTYVRGMLTRPLWEEIGDKSPDQLTPTEKEKFASFFSTSDSNDESKCVPVIPGSSLRGLIRTLVEIVGYGRMRWVSHHNPITFRAVAAQTNDPLREPYRRILGPNGSNVRAGYLEKVGEQWFIRPARLASEEWKGTREAFLKVKESIIGNKDIEGFVRLDSPNYQPKWYPVRFDVEEGRGRGSKRVFVRRIGDVRSGNRYEGVLVCSGNMRETDDTGSTTHGADDTRETKRKNHTLILPPVDDRTQRLRIPDELVTDYRNSLTPFEQDMLAAWNKGTKDMGCLGKGTPVFYVAENRQVVWFGHTPNFRVAARVPTTQRISTPHVYVPEELRADPRPDLADAIFGWVEEKGGPAGHRAGRITFSHARFTDAKDGVWLHDYPLVPHTLSAPKPTTFQHYLVQDNQLERSSERRHDPDNKATLAHYSTSPDETQIRGHKLYWHKGESPTIEATEKERKHEKQLTRIRPIKAGVRFQFRLHFENLRDEELGALWWALTLPGERDKIYRHKLGMGKSLGMGAIVITPQLYLTDRVTRYSKLFENTAWQTASEKADAQPFLTAFEQYVLNSTGLARQHSRLAEVERIQMLLAMLSWPGPTPSKTRYMEIEREWIEGKTFNEYKERPVLPDPLHVLSMPDMDQSETTRHVPKPETVLPTGYKTGRVKVWGTPSNQDIGFIKPDDGGRDIFVHRRQLPEGMNSMPVNTHVRFKVRQAPKGLQAEDVQVIK